MSSEILSKNALVDTDDGATASDNTDAACTPLDQLSKKIESQALEVAALRERLQSCEARLKALENMSPNRISLSCVGKDPIFVAPIWDKTE